MTFGGRDDDTVFFVVAVAAEATCTAVNAAQSIASHFDFDAFIFYLNVQMMLAAKLITEWSSIRHQTTIVQLLLFDWCSQPVCAILPVVVLLQTMMRTVCVRTVGCEAKQNKDESIESNRMNRINHLRPRHRHNNITTMPAINDLDPPNISTY